MRVPFTHASILAGCLGLALAWPAPAGPADPTFLREVMLLLGVAATVSGIVVAVIAWQSRAWSPTLLAVGCVSMAIGVVGRFVCVEPGLGLRPSDGAMWMPVFGMLAGAVWFALAVRPGWPTDAAQSARVRAVMGLGVALAVGGCTLLAFVPSIVPGDLVSRLMVGIAAPGYLYAGMRFLSVYRFLRLPSQLTTMVGAFFFAPSLAVAAVGGVPGVSPWMVELFMLLGAAMPVTGFIIEQRARPGLRTMVFGLFLPGAVASMRRGYPEELSVLVEDIAAYDGELRGHVDRVADLSTQLAARMGLPSSDIRGVMLAAQLHDIGKLFVPVNVLRKPGALDDAEWAIVRKHSAMGAAVVARTAAISSAARAVCEHHERWDGTGYPGGAHGVEISQAARIIAVADVFDALRSARSYKGAWSEQDALAEVRRGAGESFDPSVVEHLEALVGDSTAAAA